LPFFKKTTLGLGGIEITDHVAGKIFSEDLLLAKTHTISLVPGHFTKSLQKGLIQFLLEPGLRHKAGKEPGKTLPKGQGMIKIGDHLAGTETIFVTPKELFDFVPTFGIKLT